MPVIKLFGIAAAMLIGMAAASGTMAADFAKLAKWNDASEARIDHAAWGAFLKAYVDETSADGVNRVRYGAVSADDRRHLDAYIAKLANTNPATLGRSEAFAYWANLYNALTVDLILDHYPVKSIRDIKPSLLAIGPWKMIVVTVQGEALTLDDIEHGILRPTFKDARAHYAVNCASIGCPNLRPFPFTGEHLDQSLDQAARDYVNHPRGARFDKRGQLIVSSIYQWFAEDFGGSEQGVIAHLARYAGPELADPLKGAHDIAKYDYDWTLNEAK